MLDDGASARVKVCSIEKISQQRESQHNLNTTPKLVTHRVRMKDEAIFYL